MSSDAGANDPPEHQTDPAPENVLAGLEVQEKSLVELRRYLFTRLFQLQAEESILRAKLPERHPAKRAEEEEEHAPR